jgi:hypothetical protein
MMPGPPAGNGPPRRRAIWSTREADPKWAWRRGAVSAPNGVYGAPDR